MQQKEFLSFSQSLSFILGCIIGTGIFTSLGFQLESIHDVGWILLLWTLGAVIAFLGSMSYAYLGTLLPGNGGEVLYLSALLHPAFGYISAWVSLIAGFAAPAAASALTVGSYMEFFFPQLSATWVAAVLIVSLTLLHSISISLSGKSQQGLIYLKLLVMIFFVILCMLYGKQTLQKEQLFSKTPEWDVYAVSLLYVLYAYSGWNSFGYFAGHISRPSVQIPRLAIVSVMIVYVLYLLINLGFLKSAPVEMLQGVPDAAARACEHLLGSTKGAWLSSVLGILLISSTSAFIFTGPRIFTAQNPFLNFPAFFSKQNEKGIPVNALFVQSFISLLFVFFSNVRFILSYAGFSLSFFTLLSVLCTLRKNELYAEKFHIMFSPLPQIIFILLHMAIYYYAFSLIFKEIIFFLLILITGLAMYFISSRKRIFFLIFPLMFLSCQRDNSDSEKNISQNVISKTTIDTAVKNDYVNKEKFFEDTTCIQTSSIDSMACFISGIHPEKTGIKFPCYKLYCHKMNSRWLKSDSARFNEMESFSDREVKEEAEKRKVLFYPFSGADFLYADVFFPDCSKMIFCALEPCGTLPDLKYLMKQEDSMEYYLHQMEKSLYAILKFSFFKTKNMKEDFKTRELNGVIHLMLFFMKRRGYYIEDIYYYQCDTTGNIVKQERHKSDGFYVRLCKKGKIKEVYYYRADVSNTKWKKHERKIAAMLGKNFCTFIKSASYLMHQFNFSGIRNFILNNSGFILQDESGIPVKFIKPAEWNADYFGIYNGPIKIFTKFRQKELDSIYNKAGVARNLGFGIGYNYKDGNSCFMKFVRK